MKWAALITWILTAGGGSYCSRSRLHVAEYARLTTQVTAFAHR